MTAPFSFVFWSLIAIWCFRALQQRLKFAYSCSLFDVALAQPDKDALGPFPYKG